MKISKPSMGQRLRYLLISGCSYEEIARRLDLKIYDVKKRIDRMLKLKETNNEEFVFLATPKQLNISDRRNFVRIAYTQGVLIADIAETFNVPIGTVNSDLRYLKKQDEISPRKILRKKDELIEREQIILTMYRKLYPFEEIANKVNLSAGRIGQVITELEKKVVLPPRHSLLEASRIFGISPNILENMLHEFPVPSHFWKKEKGKKRNPVTLSSGAMRHLSHWVNFYKRCAICGEPLPIESPGSKLCRKRCRIISGRIQQLYRVQFLHEALQKHHVNSSEWVDLSEVKTILSAGGIYYFILLAKVDWLSKKPHPTKRNHGRGGVNGMATLYLKSEVLLIRDTYLPTKRGRRS